MPENTTQGQRLRTMRQRAGYTMDAVAAQLSTTKQAIYKYEMDIVQNIPADKLCSLARLYGCGTDYLKCLTDQPGTPPEGELPPPAAARSTAHRAAQELTDLCARLTPDERRTVLEFAQFLAARHTAEG